MKGYSACVEMLFADLDFLARVRAARAAGFAAVEFWRWYDKDLSGLAETGMPVAAAMVDTRNGAARAAFSKTGMMAKASAAMFKDMVAESIGELRAVGSPLLIIAPGQELSTLSRGAQEDNIIECLLAAKPLLEKSGASLAIEPLNPLVDHVGCYLYSSRQAFEIARAADSPNIGVLFDIYHQQITEGNVTANIRANLSLIKHFHTADVPGRREPGTGEINYKNVIRAIREAGYSGYVGCEFRPTGDTRAASEYILSL